MIARREFQIDDVLVLRQIGIEFIIDAALNPFLFPDGAEFMTIGKGFTVSDLKAGELRTQRSREERVDQSDVKDLQETIHEILSC